MSEKIKRKIEERVSIDVTSGCWVWCGKINEHNQPTMYVGRKRHKVCRLSFETYIGEIFDPAIACGPSCGNRKCVNPDHMSLRRKGQKAILKTHCKWGHELTDRNVYSNGKKRYCKICVAARNAARRAKKSKPHKRTTA